MATIVVTTYTYPNNPTNNFATAYTLTFHPRFAIRAELSYEAGEKKLAEMAAAFNQEIEVREHEDFIVREVTIPLP